jgi:hypothetical protein
MTLDWRQLEPVDVAAAWQRVVDANPQATFFHTPAWAELLHKTLPGWQPDSVAVEFSDGMLAVLPLLRRDDSEHRESMAPYVYGGPLFSGVPSEAHLDEIGKVPRWYSDIVLYGNPFSPFEWCQDGLIRWRIHTHVVDLSPGFDSIFDHFRRAIRQQCCGAERNGVEISVARDILQVDQYYDAYLDCLHRWGEATTSFYPLALFHRLFDLQEHGDGVRIWVAELAGRVVGGVTVLYHGDHAVAWHSATQSECLSLPPSPFVHMTAIRAACADGFRWYDFNPSGRLKGVEWFKEGFATERRRFDMYASPSATQPPTLRTPTIEGGHT